MFFLMRERSWTVSFLKIIFSACSFCSVFPIQDTWKSAIGYYVHCLLRMPLYNRSDCHFSLTGASNHDNNTLHLYLASQFPKYFHVHYLIWASSQPSEFIYRCFVSFLTVIHIDISHTHFPYLYGWLAMKSFNQTEQ